MVYPTLLPLTRTPRLPVVDWTDAPAGRYKWTRPFHRKTKSGFCACAITFQTQSTMNACVITGNIFIVSKMHICSICDMSSCRILILVTVRLDGQNIRIFRLNESTARVQSYRRPPCIVLITYKQNKAGELASVTELHRCCRHATKHLTHLLWFACNTNSPFAFFSLWAVFPV